MYGILKQHEGYINVSSEPGKGTTFEIYLPIIESMVAEAKKESSSLATSPVGTETILVAEDDAELRYLSKTLLEESGYKVIEAENGHDALIKFKESNGEIKLLLLDIIMPVMNGKGAYDEIRKINPDIKTLFISGYSEKVINKKIIFEEGLNFISKPFSQSELLMKVREALDN